MKMQMEVATTYVSGITRTQKLDVLTDSFKLPPIQQPADQKTLISQPGRQGEIGRPDLLPKFMIMASAYPIQARNLHLR